MGALALVPGRHVCAVLCRCVGLASGCDACEHLRVETGRPGGCHRGVGRRVREDPAKEVVVDRVKRGGGEDGQVHVVMHSPLPKADARRVQCEVHVGGAS